MCSPDIVNNQAIYWISNGILKQFDRPLGSSEGLCGHLMECWGYPLEVGGPFGTSKAFWGPLGLYERDT